MSPTIDKLVKAAVDDFAQAVPHRSGLADIALRKAARRKHAARLAVAGGAAVALAVAVPLGIGELGQGRTTTVTPATTNQPQQPTQTPTNQPRVVTEGPARKTVTARLDDLRQGPASAVPWYGDGAIHVAGSTIPFDLEFDRLHTMRAVSGGVVVLLQREKGTSPLELFLVAPDGRRTPLASGISQVAVSADGSKLAWSKGNQQYLADATTGEIQHQSPSPAPNLFVYAFAGDRVALTGQGPEGNNGQVYLWDPSRGTTEKWLNGSTAISGITGDGKLIARQLRGNCFGVTDIRSGRELWRSCELSFWKFSPDGRYLATVPFRRDPELPIVILDARTGERLLTINLQSYRDSAWQPDGSLVFSMEELKGNGFRLGLGRCSVDGRCDRVTSIFESGQDAHEVRSPYLGYQF